MQCNSSILTAEISQFKTRAFILSQQPQQEGRNERERKCTHRNKGGFARTDGQTPQQIRVSAEALAQCALLYIYSSVNRAQMRSY
jgi:hypothetical protein